MDAPIIEIPATQNKKNVNMSSASKTINSSLGDAVDSTGMVIFMFYFFVSFFCAAMFAVFVFFFSFLQFLFVDIAVFIFVIRFIVQMNINQGSDSNKSSRSEKNYHKNDSH